MLAITILIKNKIVSYSATTNLLKLFRDILKLKLENGSLVIVKSVRPKKIVIIQLNKFSLIFLT